MSAQPKPETASGAGNSSTRRSSLHSGLDILLLLSRHQALTLTEISHKLDRAKSGVHSILTTLQGRGFVERLPRGGYRLGTSAWDLGRASFPFEIGRLVKPVLEQLEQRTGESVLMGVLDGFDVVYLHSLPGNHPVRVDVRPGERHSASLTSTGLALLAALDDRRIAELLPSDFKIKSARSIKTAQELWAEIARTRERGYGAMTGNWHPDVAGVARCIRDPSGTSVGAICVSAPRYRVDDTWRTKVLGDLELAVSAIETELQTTARQAEERRL